MVTAFSYRTPHLTLLPRPPPSVLATTPRIPPLFSRVNTHTQQNDKREAVRSERLQTVPSRASFHEVHQGSRRPQLSAASTRTFVSMSSVNPKLPLKAWLRLHGKAICQALPLSFLIVVEARDLYYRATWDVAAIPPSKFEVGDVVAVCNRWYTLPTWSHVVYSWLSKVLLKSCWDDVAVVSRVADGGRPYILYADFTGVHETPLDTFLEERCPRGAAVRKLHRDVGVPPLSESISTLFTKEVAKLPVEPWYLFSASMRANTEHRYYEFCVGMHEQRCKIRGMLERRQTRQAVEAQQQTLKEMEVMRKHLASQVEPVTVFHLFNGSLVASFFATYGLIDRELPSPSRYVPQDFAHTIPFLGASTLEEPLVFFKN